MALSIRGAGMLWKLLFHGIDVPFARDALE
jgi:hypothetical protein